MSPAEAFLNDLDRSSRPGILVGGGAYKARKEILAFALAKKIPVFRTWNALDVCPDDHPCYGGTVGTYGGPGRNFGDRRSVCRNEGTRRRIRPVGRR